MNAFLVEAARDHSDWMIANDIFSHTGAGGSSAGDRMEAAGYVFAGAWSWGENLALRTGALSAGTAAALHDQLVLSPGHRTNLMADIFREVGLGLGEGLWDWGLPTGVRTSAALTENFAKSGTALFLLGVAFDDGDGDGFYDPGEGLGGLTVSIRNMATGATTALSTWAAGGWQAPLAAGSYEVTFSGGALGTSVTRGITLGTANAKLDLNRDAAPAGAATLLGTHGAETITAGDGHDVVNARGGHDWVFGGVGNDNLVGLTGADTLLGGSGRDRLNGGEGNDVLIGGPGVDVLFGGTGADRFVFLSTLDRTDRIMDFNAAEGDRVVIDRAIAATAGGLAPALHRWRHRRTRGSRHPQPRLLVAHRRGHHQVCRLHPPRRQSRGRRHHVPHGARAAGASRRLPGASRGPARRHRRGQPVLLRRHGDTGDLGAFGRRGAARRLAGDGTRGDPHRTLHPRRAVPGAESRHSAHGPGVRAGHGRLVRRARAARPRADRAEPRCARGDLPQLRAGFRADLPACLLHRARRRGAGGDRR
ncbi:hypothetical protein J4558_26020 [Leptolyngbya sp. 15MV]|nr:hypothetical protein J4558_26020 [Leptolyngbya sp. 15MV]